jgi:hypothetical protein
MTKLDRIHARDICFEETRHILKVPNFNFHVNRDRVRQLVGIDFTLNSEYDYENNVSNNYLVVKQKDLLGTSINAFVHKFAEAMNNYMCEKEVEIYRKENKEKKDLEEFETNKFPHYELLSETFEAKYMIELQEYANHMMKRVEEWRKDGDIGMMVCKYCDAKDIALILYYLKKGDIKKAREESHLDTCIREGIPDSVWDLYEAHGVLNDY